jgi:hypothetical protein
LTNPPYIRIQDIECANDNHQTVVTTLLSDIVNLEKQLIIDEEFLEALRRQIGDMNTDYISRHTLDINKRLLLSLKVAFWYYTGISPSKVLVEADPEFNMFSV